MNKRKLKFELISRIMSKGQMKYPLQYIKNLLREFKTEVGSILSIDHLNTEALSEVLDQEKFELKFERMTINLELVRNRRTRNTTVKDFIMS